VSLSWFPRVFITHAVVLICTSPRVMWILARVVADRGVARFKKWGGQSMKSSGRTGIRRGLPYTHYTGCGKKVSRIDFGQYIYQRLIIFPQKQINLNKISRAYHMLTSSQKLHSFIQLSLTLTKLCHIDRDHLVNFYISLKKRIGHPPSGIFKINL